MASLLETLLGKDNPVASWAGNNSNLLTGLGTSLLSSGMNFAPAQAGAAMDVQAAQQRDADAKLAASTTATKTWLAQNFPDLAQAVDAGLPVSDAWQEAFKRQQPGYGQTGGEPFTLGPDQTRYAGDGSVLATGVPSAPDPKEAFNREKDLSAQYLGTEPLKTYQTVRNGYEKLRSSSQLNSGPGDISTIFAYMKMLDPTSVVREQEYATAANSSGVPETVRGLYNSLVDGQRLTPEQRAQFVAAGESIYADTANNLSDINSQFSTRATGWDVDPTRFIINPEAYGNIDPLNIRGGR